MLHHIIQIFLPAFGAVLVFTIPGSIFACFKAHRAFQGEKTKQFVAALTLSHIVVFLAGCEAVMVLAALQNHYHPGATPGSPLKISEEEAKITIGLTIVPPLIIVPIILKNLWRALGLTKDVLARLPQ